MNENSIEWRKITDNLTVSFLGKEYSIPADILTYIDLLNFTDSVQKQLVSAFVRKLRNELDKGNFGCFDDKVMAPDIEQQVGKYTANSKAAPSMFGWCRAGK